MPASQARRANASAEARSLCPAAASTQTRSRTTLAPRSASSLSTGAVRPPSRNVSHQVHVQVVGTLAGNYLCEHPDQNTKAYGVAQRHLRRTRDRVDQLARAARPERASVLAQKIWVIHERLRGNPGT